MEKELKFILQVAVALAVIWALAKVLGKKMVKSHHKNDPTQFPDSSLFWSRALVAKPNATTYGQMPQTALYAQ